MINVLVHSLGTALFGYSAIISFKASRMILNTSLLIEVEDGMISHMLWVLHFMKCYQKERITCAITGQSIKKGLVIDPKKLCKYVWSFIYVLSELESEVLKAMFCHHWFVQMPSLNFVYLSSSTGK
jgi:hypothetical protein